MTVRWLSVLLATFSCIALSIAAQAENEWMLWERQLDVKGQPSGEWRRKQVFETERWCKGAMTTAINQMLIARGSKPADVKRGMVEYQCLPSTADPAAPKSSR